MIVKTVATEWYTVTSTGKCTVTATHKGQVYELADLISGGQCSFQAVSEQVEVSDDTAIVLGPFKAAPAAGVSGMGGLSVARTGRIVALECGTMPAGHEVWYSNDTYTDITVQPADVTDRVLTFYLKTSIPVKLAGVTWLYGEPAMIEGFTYVIAMQQLGDQMLANLAYTLKS